MNLNGITRKSISILDNIEGHLCKILLSFFVTLLFIQVIMRTVFSNSLAWSEECSRFAFVWFSFLGAAYAARLGAHNRVVFQFKFFPKIVGSSLQIFADLIWIFFNSVMTVKSIETIQGMIRYPFHSPAMDVPMHYIYMLFPITFTLMTIRIVQTNILKYVLKRELKDVDDISSEMEDIRHDMKIEPENEGRST